MSDHPPPRDPTTLWVRAFHQQREGFWVYNIWLPVAQRWTGTLSLDDARGQLMAVGMSPTTASNRLSNARRQYTRWRDRQAAGR